MLNRRDCLKGFAGLTAALAFYPVNDSDTLISTCEGNTLSCEVIKVTETSYIPKVIFCQFEDQKLGTAIAKCAEDIDCEVINGVPFTPDMLAFSGFVNIIDRNLVEKDVWQEYVNWYDEFRRDETCIIIDNIILDMPMPVSRYMPAFDLNNPYSAPVIITMIKSLKDIYAESYRRRDLINSIFDNVDSGLIFLDYKRNTFMINRNACSMLNVNPEKIDFEAYDTFLSQIRSQKLHNLLKERGVIAKALRGGGIRDAYCVRQA